MEKRQRRILLLALSDSRPPLLHAFLCEQVTPAAVSRQERSDRVSEEASFHRYSYSALTPCIRIFPLPHEALS